MFHNWRAYFPVLSEVSLIRNNLVLILLAKISGWNWYRWESNTPFFRKVKAIIWLTVWPQLKKSPTRLRPYHSGWIWKQKFSSFHFENTLKMFSVQRSNIFWLIVLVKKTRLGKGISWLSWCHHFRKSGVI